jgi:hypothetical protein
MFGFFRFFVTGRTIVGFFILFFTGRTIVGFSDSSSLVDLSLISWSSLSLEGASVGFLEDSSSEVNRVGFGLGLLFFADGVTLLFF